MMQSSFASNVVLNLTDANDSSIDRGQFVAANDPDLAKTSNCNLSAISIANSNGVVAINITGSPTLDPLPSAIEAGQPSDSYGWFRFQTKVK